MPVYEIDANGRRFEVEAPNIEAATQALSTMQAPAAPPAPAAPGRGMIGFADDVVRSIANGVTFGWGDEIAAKMGSLTGIGGKAGDYEGNLARERARDAEISNAISIPGQVAGAVGGTLAAAPVAAAVRLPGALASLAQLPSRVRYGALGGAEGALSGAGGATEGERLSGAVSGAVIGAPIGAVAPDVVRGVANTAGAVRRAFDPEYGAAADIARAIRRDADTPATLAARADDLAQARPGVATLGDAGGENVRGLVERVAQTPGAGRTQVVPSLTERQQAQGARIAEDLRGLTGTTRSATRAIEETMAERTATARPLYDEAFNFNARQAPEVVQAWERETSSGWGRRLLNSPELRLTLQTEYGIQNAADAPLMVLIDAWKRRADDVISARRGTNDARVVGAMRDRVVSVLDAANPAYPRARDAWAGPSRFRDAIEDGRSVMNRGESAEELAARMRGMSESEREGFRIGAVSALVNKIRSDPARMSDVTKHLRSPEMREKIALLMPSEEAAQRWTQRLGFEVSSSELTGRALGNSATARRLAEREDAHGLVGDLVLDALAGGASGSIFKQVFQRGPAWLRDTLRSRRDAAIADQLTNPQRINDLPQMMQRLEAARNARPSGKTNATAISGFLSGI